MAKKSTPPPPVKKAVPKRPRKSVKPKAY